MLSKGANPFECVGRLAASALSLIGPSRYLMRRSDLVAHRVQRKSQDNRHSVEDDPSQTLSVHRSGRVTGTLKAITTGRSTIAVRPPETARGAIFFTDRVGIRPWPCSLSVRLAVRVPFPG